MGVKIPILCMLWPIEFLGLLLKCVVLSVRLFANMFAGHIVLGTILLFVPMVKNSGPVIAGTVTFASVFGAFALQLSGAVRGVPASVFVHVLDAAVLRRRSGSTPSTPPMRATTITATAMNRLDMSTHTNPWHTRDLDSHSLK